jgi:hypothetical protein
MNSKKPQPYDSTLQARNDRVRLSILRVLASLEDAYDALPTTSTPAQCVRGEGNWSLSEYECTMARTCAEAILRRKRLQERMTRPADPPTPVTALAAEFCHQLRKALSADQMQQVVQRNAEETNPSVCHSHDFCDANALMNTVFYQILGYDANDTQKAGYVTMSEPSWKLWSEAWDLAKKSGFSLKPGLDL